MIITTTKNFHNLCYPHRNDHTFIKITYLILIIPRREKKRFCVEQNAILKPRLQKIMGNILLTLSSLTSLPSLRPPHPISFAALYISSTLLVPHPPRLSAKILVFRWKDTQTILRKQFFKPAWPTQRPAILAQLTRFESQ